MGGNGSFFSGITNFEENRRYKTILSIGDNIKILETKNPRLGLKLPEESHTPNRIYAAFCTAFKYFILAKASNCVGLHSIFYTVTSKPGCTSELPGSAS